jgi:hypothetical protein
VAVNEGREAHSRRGWVPGRVMAAALPSWALVADVWQQWPDAIAGGQAAREGGNASAGHMLVVVSGRQLQKELGQRTGPIQAVVSVIACQQPIP